MEPGIEIETWVETLTWIDGNINSGPGMKTGMIVQESLNGNNTKALPGWL